MYKVNNKNKSSIKPKKSALRTVAFNKAASEHPNKLITCTTMCVRLGRCALALPRKLDWKLKKKRANKKISAALRTHEYLIFRITLE